MSAIVNVYPLTNKKGRNTIKHCLIGFYHNEKYKNISNCLVCIGELEIIDTSELETIVNLINHKIMTDDKDSLFHKNFVNYITFGFPFYLDKEKHSASRKHKDERDKKVIDYVKELMEKYQVSLEENSLEVCFDVSFPEWWYNNKLNLNNENT